MTLKEIVKGKTAKFKFYRDGELWYETDDGFDFPIPISDTGTGIFKAEEKAIQFMRWIRKQLEAKTEWEKERQAHTRKTPWVMRINRTVVINPG